MQDSILVTGEQATVHVNAPAALQAGHEARQRYLTRPRHFCQALPLATRASLSSTTSDFAAWCAHASDLWSLDL